MQIEMAAAVQADLEIAVVAFDPGAVFIGKVNRMARRNAEMSQYGETTERDRAFQASFAFQHTAPLCEWSAFDYIS
ncbi:hypothetical protein, partial [Nitrosomonas sp.]|uniref:hypothetical protein n=1 Tax=Nitrosomonas sp. TaxID=42353 RepID=UPI0025FDF079